jgi:propionate catabolism operon transcriptional regulator
METTKSQTGRRARIGAFGSSFVRLLPELIPSYEDVAEVRIVDKIFDDALAVAENLLQTGEIDAVIAAGANGAFLRNRLRGPVVLLRVSGFDILHALARAREVSDRIAILSYQMISTELEEVKQILKLDIEQRFYTTLEDAAQRVRELQAAGFKVVVGSNTIQRLAKEAGMKGVFLYSANSARQALEDAIEIARVARLEESRREWLNSILRHLDDGIAAVDMEERIQSLNPAMAKLLGVSVEWASGRRLSELSPVLGLDATLRSGSPELGQVQRLGQRTLVINRLPIREHGAQTGAVLTCQDALTIQRADRNIRSRDRSRSLVARYSLSQIMGDSETITETRALAAQYAGTDATVLITGESGTGKELLAQGIHNASRRRDEPFVAINCGAFPESLLESELFGYEEGAFTGSRRGGKAGLFEAAHNGTIFLDEVTEIPLALQSRLLRVLQEKEVLRLGSTDPIMVDVRVIAATNRDIRQSVAEGKFREDVYYRLNILRLHVPPLRDRVEDIAVIARHLMSMALQRHGSPRPAHDPVDQILPHFERYPWPGNVREMENIIERIAVFVSGSELSRRVDPRHLENIVPELFGSRPYGPSGPSDNGLKSIGRTIELDHIRKVLQESGGDQREAARRLGISRTTLWRRLKARQ